MSTVQRNTDQMDGEVATVVLDGERVVFDGERIMMFDPADVIEPEATNVRRFDSGRESEEEIRAIEELAAVIEQEGQLQPGRVRVNEAGLYELIMGRRRKRAISLINAGRAPGQEMKFAAIVTNGEVGDQKAKRQAFIENWHRKGLSAINLALLIADVRAENKWKGGKNTKKVAEYLGVSAATITQHEKLLTLTPELMEKVHTGELSAQDGMDLVDVKPEKREEVLAKKKELDAKDDGKDDGSTKASAKKKVKATVRAAVHKSSDGVSDKPKPRTKTEIMEFFEGMLGPAYGYANGSIHTFIAKLSEYAAGVIGDRTLEKYWDAMVVDAPRGTAEAVKETKEDKKVVSAVPGKKVTRPAKDKKKKAAKKK